MKMHRIALAALALCAVSGAAMAQPAQNRGLDGKRLADQYCARCHAIVPGEASWTDAPTFPAIANRPGTNVQGLRAIIQAPHENMLNDRRSPAQADAIAAYIISLRQD